MKRGVPRRPRQALSALMRGLEVIHTELAQPQALAALLDMAIDTSGAARGFLVMDRSGALQAEVARNFEKLSLDDQEMQFSRSVVQQVIDSGKPLLTDNAGTDERFSAAASVQAYGLHSIICVPLAIQGKTRGVLYLDHSALEAFEEADLDFLAAMASQAALVLFSQQVMEDQRRIRDLLSKYVSPEVADELLSSKGSSMVARHQNVSVMFSDIRGFSTMAETMDPVEVLGVLNRYYDRLVEVVFRHQGTLVSFMGDGVMVVFGAPLASSDHARRALAAGQELQEAAQRFREEGLALRVGVGIDSGDAVVGDIGSQKRREYTVLGSPVKVAERVEKLTNELKQPILFSEATYELGGRVGTLVGEHRLTGIETPVRLYAPA